MLKFDDRWTAKALKDEASMITVAASLGADKQSDMSVFQRLAIFMVRCGMIARELKHNAAPSAAPLFDAFDTEFRKDSFRKPLEESSKKTWRSAFGAFTEAGYFGAWDIMPYVEKAIENPEKALAFTTRGARIRELMEKHKLAAPTAEQADAILNPKTEPSTNPLLDFAKSVQRRVSDAGLTETDKASKVKSDGPALAQAKANPRQRLALIALQDAAAALVRACESNGGMSRDDEVATLKAKLAELNA